MRALRQVIPPGGSSELENDHILPHTMGIGNDPQALAFVIDGHSVLLA